MKSKKNNKDEQMALFRYAIIAPVISQTKKEVNAYFKQMAEKEWELPTGLKKIFKPTTFKNWLAAYRKSSLDGLKPKNRTDKRCSRKIDSYLQEVIIQMKKDYPFLSASGIYRMLCAEGHIQPDAFTEQTLRKFLREKKLLFVSHEIKPRKKFEKKFINDLWILDFLHGPYIRGDSGKKQKSYLLCIIDDHSRFITGWNWSCTDNSLTVEKALKDAISTYGLPTAIYCDNAKVFSTSHLQMTCARLGIALIHSKPYDPQSRGKLERFFRTARDGCLARLKTKKLTLQELQDAFKFWLDDEYHTKFHSGINTTPRQRYLEGLKHTTIRRLSQEEIDNSFYQTVVRVVKNDSTVSIKNKLYEVPTRFIGEKVEIRFPTAEPERVTLYENGKPVCALNLLDVHFNAEFPPRGIRFLEAQKKAREQQEQTEDSLRGGEYQ